MDAGESRPLLVEHAVEPAQYRVYPDTPLAEVVDLMVRRSARAIPVIGEQYEVLGIITTSDALGQMLDEGPGEGAFEEDGPRTARDIMTRAVLCVSETEPLAEAGRMMVKRKVEQLPVVRDGELIGLITRDAVLHALHVGTRPEEPKETDDS